MRAIKNGRIISFVYNLEPALNVNVRIKTLFYSVSLEIQHT
jgi:hypothetical protein